MNTIAETTMRHLSHDMVCCYCEHPRHTYLPCSDTCDCVPPPAPGLFAEPRAQAWPAGLVDPAA